MHKKNKYMQGDNVNKNFVLIGEMGSGKDEFAKLLPGFSRVAFSDEIRLVVKNLRINGAQQAYWQLYNLYGQRPPNGLIDKLHELSAIPQLNTKDRKLLQELGTYCRSKDKFIWIRKVLDNISKDKKYVVTDCRRKSELDACVALGFIPIFIEADMDIRRQRLIDRDGSYDEATFYHEAEQEIRDLKKYCTWVVANNGALEELEGCVDIIVTAEELK